ncbi:MAG: hypothetical protein QMC97_02940 [Pseudothermotoga sp.]|uniref:hypothetical protein n=1 Tax=Pseudothermotoga sp. TaxID=2033661 RepID=UPI002582DFBD|nr:hypothetical protein [Pseudothermotoga sp.]MDI6862324.1 hypothetical protein [Pseudothermotoga sp.]
MSDCEELLKRIAERFNCKVWVCEKVGKRTSHIPGMKAGEERFVPPMVGFEDEEYVVFVQVDEMSDQLKDMCGKVIECVRSDRKDRTPPRKCDT